MTRKLQELHRDVATRLRRFLDAPPDADATPLEIMNAVVDEVERAVQPVGRGRRVLPYRRLTVRVRPNGLERAALERALAGLDGRIRERLVELGCEPSPLDVRLQILKRPPADWNETRTFSVDFHAAQEAEAPAPSSPAIPPIHIAVVRGAAARKAFTFADPVVSIGRSADPSDGLGRMRHNRLAFADIEDGVTETVGRAHARLVFEPARGGYLLFDDGSSNGTSIARAGASIRVPPRDPRGVRIMSGDEVHLGRAVIRVTLAGS